MSETHKKLWAEYYKSWKGAPAARVSYVEWLEGRIEACRLGGEADMSDTKVVLSRETSGVTAEALPARWRRISEGMEIDKRGTKWESEAYLSLCAVQCTLERCADELEAALAGKE